MEFKNEGRPCQSGRIDQTMQELAACYNGLTGVKPVKKFESRDVAVTRIWAVVSPEKPQVARKRKAAHKKATSGRKSGKTAAKKIPCRSPKINSFVKSEVPRL